LRRPASLRSRTRQDRGPRPPRVRPASAGTRCVAQPTSAQQTLALCQIATKLGVPAQYLRKCPWDLRAENVNHGLNESRTPSFLLRCDGDEDHCGSGQAPSATLAQRVSRRVHEGLACCLMPHSLPRARA
jgi:hypothetical protein